MAIFDFIKRIFGGSSPPECPNCGLKFSWNGKRCGHCRFPHHQTARPADTANRDFSTSVNASNVEVVGAIGDGGAIQDQKSSAPAARQSSMLAGLDVDKFAPITMDDALEQTKAANWKTAYLDPMNIIPSADIPRINVIDKTMVGLGLISDNELAEIHKIGEEFEQYRTDFRVILDAGHKAVAQSREEKLQRKLQKQAEAAARKKAYEEGVAHRKSTDIFFLGRGVSKGLHDRRAHVEKLTQSGLPVLATPGEFAKAIDVEIPKLRWLAFHSVAAKQVHYVNFSVPKKSGGERRLSAPHQHMAAAQRWIFENVLQKIEPHSAAQGFVSGRSIVTNAAAHVGADVVINVDLKDFFPTITFWRVEGLFRSLGYSPAVATIMALLCTECPRETVKYNGQTYHVATGQRGLPQGACTSPAISNLVARHLDHRLTGMADKLGWSYTRYADDITYSQKLEEGVDRESSNKMIGYVLARLRHMAEDEGFAINEKKTRVLRNQTRQSVTGVVVNDQIGVARPTVRKLRAILHNAKKNGLESQNRDGRDDFGAWLNGMISYVEMVNAGQGAKLRRSFDEVIAGKL